MPFCKVSTDVKRRRTVLTASTVHMLTVCQLPIKGLVRLCSFLTGIRNVVKRSRNLMALRFITV